MAILDRLSREIFKRKSQRRERLEMDRPETVIDASFPNVLGCHMINK